MSTKVLIIDDEPDLDRLMRQKLRRRMRGGEIVLISARNGLEALAILSAQHDVGVAFCDINMPQMDGLTLLLELRAKYPTVKTVMISAYGDRQNVECARERGAVEFLTKPLDLSRLDNALQQLLPPAAAA